MHPIKVTIHSMAITVTMQHILAIGLLHTMTVPILHIMTITMMPNNDSNIDAESVSNNDINNAAHNVSNKKIVGLTLTMMGWSVPRRLLRSSGVLGTTLQRQNYRYQH